MLSLINGYNASNGSQRGTLGKTVSMELAEAPARVSIGPKKQQQQQHPPIKEEIKLEDGSPKINEDKTTDELRNLKLQMHKLRLSNMNYRKELTTLKKKVKT